MSVSEKKYYLIVGLGNPEPKYDHTRHNIGFRVLDFFLNHLVPRMESGSFQDFTIDQKHKSLVAITQVSSHSLILAKPQTFMNRSGEAIQSLVSYYKIILENILIIHDDIDLPFGTIRFSHEAGPAGHNGVRSVIEQLGSKEFTRLRIGVGQSENGENENSKSFVLKNFTKKEDDELCSRVVPNAARTILTFLDKGYEQAAATHNQKPKIKDTVPLSGAHGDDLGGK